MTDLVTHCNQLLPLWAYLSCTLLVNICLYMRRPVFLSFYNILVLKILVKEFKMLELQLHVLFQLVYISQIFMDQLFYFLIGQLKIYTWANVSRWPSCSFNSQLNLVTCCNSVRVWSLHSSQLFLSYQHITWITVHGMLFDHPQTSSMCTSKSGTHFCTKS